MADTAKFSSEILEYHNRYRSQHESPDLAIDDRLNKFAQEWAEDLAKRDIFERRPNNSYGENLYVATSKNINWEMLPEEVVKSWYNEIKFYKFDEPSADNLTEVGHFTQLVWNNTETMGLGIGISESKKIYIVCNYNPPGNIKGQFKDNVRRAKNHTERPETNNNSRASVHKDSENEMPVDFVPSPSLEQLGIDPRMQPKPEMSLRMRKLFGISSNKITEWISWLIKIIDKAKQYEKYLRQGLEVIKTLIEAVQYIKRKKELDHAFLQGNQVLLPGRRPIEELAIGKVKKKKERPKRKYEINKPSKVRKPNKMKSDNKISMRLLQREESVLNESQRKIIDKPQWRHLTNDTTEEKDSSQVKDVMETSKKISCPIGVTWTPKEFKKKDKKTETETEAEDRGEGARENFPEVQTCSLPIKSKEEFEELLKRLKDEAAIYHSLCGRWKKINEQMVKQIIDRTVFPPDELFEDTEVLRYRSYNANSMLTDDWSLDLSDNEPSLQDQTHRELLIHDNKSKLYFNLQ
ncbi:uncharacterized protein LOC130674985 [Microplitis mediator]|uniref:uncharacterized protein LOC130674985 n=1 Tax=Microplitis mediator TaxID=375433 RepID=UPI002556DE49|nr:uncharacterized protein LOC130674985 [Microplitis mediator]